MNRNKVSVKELLTLASLPEGKARLRRFSLRVRDGREHDPKDLVAIADAFDAILEGQEPRVALGIAGKQHQGRPKQRAGEWGARVFSPVFEVELVRRADRLTLDGALDRVSAEQGMSRETLEKHQKKYGKLARGLLDILHPKTE